jgi:putative DNA primase/helicase
VNDRIDVIVGLIEAAQAPEAPPFDDDARPRKPPRRPAPQPRQEKERASATLADETHSPVKPPDPPPPEALPDEGPRGRLPRCARFDHSDTDNGKRLREYFGDRLLVMAQEGIEGGDWLTWAGTHWDLSGGAAGAARLAQLVGDLIVEEAEHLPTWPGERAEQLEARRTRRRGFGVSSKNKARIAGMLACAAPHIRRPPEAWNADPYLVATATHTLRFFRELDPWGPDPKVEHYLAGHEAIAGHRRSDLITALVPVKYDPHAKGPRWTAFMERFQPSAEQRRTVQQFTGLGLLGVPIQRLAFHVGTGGNGKSTFLETICRVLGDTFAVGLPAESITGFGDRGAGQASPDIARLFGKRLLRVQELPPGKPLQVEVVKRLTGGEKIPVRTLFKGYFEFSPQAKAHMSGNDYPTFDGSDGGMRRRLLVIDWPVQLPESEQRDFEEVVGELMEEAPAILNWLIAGALDYLQHGLVVAESIRRETREYFDEMDPVGQFAAACVQAQPGENVAARTMYRAYESWSLANSRRPVSETKFARVMKKKHYARDETTRIRLYLDVRLVGVPERPSDGPPGAEPAGGLDQTFEL